MHPSLHTLQSIIQNRRYVATYQVYFRRPRANSSHCPRKIIITLSDLDAPADCFSFSISGFADMIREERFEAIRYHCSEAGIIAEIEALHEVGHEIEVTLKQFKYL